MKNYCVKIKYVAEQIRGVSYKPEDISDIKSDDHIPLLRANNIQKGQLCLKDLVYVDCKKVQKKQHILPNDILICASSGSKDLVGKAIKICTPGFTFGAFCKVLRPSGVVDPDYFSAFFQSERYKFNISNSAIGININNIRSEHLDDMSLPLPSKEEQRQKAKVINKLNEIIEKKQNQIFYLEQIIKSRFMEMFGNAVLNDKHWDVKPLLQLSSLITNGNTPAGGSENYVSTGVMFLRSQNIWRKTIDLKDIVFIDQKTHENLKRSNLQNKDILITKTGRINTENSSLGRAAIFYGKNGSANINGHVYLVRIKGTVLPEFVLEILTSEEYRDYIRKVCVGGIDKRQINLEHVEQFPIILPPIDLQNQFVSFIKKIDKSKLAVQKSIEQLEILKKSLMQEYFG